MIVLSDTSPLNYLILIGQDKILPQLFGKVAIPMAVVAELSDRRSPAEVRRWIESPPEWLEIRTPTCLDTTIELGRGEVEAISLASELHAELILIDDRLARKAARHRGLNVAGTIAVLQSAAQLHLIDFQEVIHSLVNTTFRLSRKQLAEILAEHEKRSD